MRYEWQVYPALEEGGCCSAVIRDSYGRTIRFRDYFTHERLAHDWIDEQFRQMREAAA